MCAHFSTENPTVTNTLVNLKQYFDNVMALFSTRMATLDLASAVGEIQSSHSSSSTPSKAS